MAGIVIVGAGHGGFTCADALRKGGYTGELHLIDADSLAPYQKPPLSKEYLLEDMSTDSLLFRADKYYEQQSIQLLLNTKLKGIDRIEKSLYLSNGKTIEYDKLVLALGASLRPFSVDEGNVSNTCYIKTIADIEQISERLEQVSQVVVIGGGFIALEFAAVARKLGKQVDLIIRGDRMMRSAVSSDIAALFHTKHSQEGVRVHYNTHIVAAQKQGEHTLLTDQNGHQYHAELLVAGIGVTANDALASACGLDTDQGIVVNEYCQTSDPDVYAIGDVARFIHPLLGREVRLESVQNAVDQAKVVASHLLDSPVPYDAVPWFWSNQYDLKLQMAGVLDQPDQAIVRGSQETYKFSVFYYRGGRLQAVHSINKPADHMAARKMLAKGVSPAQELLTDESVKLNDLIPKV